MVPDVNHSKLSELENGRLSDRYRIALDTGCIVSNCIGCDCIGETDITCITAGSAAVNGSHYTGQLKGVRTLSPDVLVPFDHP